MKFARSLSTAVLLAGVSILLGCGTPETTTAPATPSTELPPAAAPAEAGSGVSGGAVAPEAK